MSFEPIYAPKDSVTLKGRWTATLYGEDGLIKDKVDGKNVVCTNGKEFLASFLYSAAVAASTFTCKYVAVGTDATAETAANTALGVELTRTTGTVSYLVGQIYRVTATFATGVGTGSIVEYGLFSSSAAGTLLSRTTQPVITKGANDVLVVTTNITLS